MGAIEDAAPQRGTDVGIDIAAGDQVELLSADLSLARALFDGVPVARLLARARVGRDERDLAAPAEGGRVSFTFDALLVRVCSASVVATDRVKVAVARQARAASVEGPLAASDATIATLVYAVAIAPDPDASMAEAFLESTQTGLTLKAAETIGAYVEKVGEAAAAYDARVRSVDPRGALFEACVRLATRAVVGPMPASRLFEAARRLYRAGLASPLLRPAASPLYPQGIDAEMPRKLRRMVSLDRAPLEALTSRDPRELAAALARLEGARESSAEIQLLRLDSLVADLTVLLGHAGAPALAVKVPEPEPLAAPDSARPSWQPHDWSSREAAEALATALERGTTTLPRAYVLVQRGGDAALDAVGAEMLRVDAHPYASAAIAEILARSQRPRDVMRLVTYFAVAPDPTIAARTLSACGAPELPGVLRAWLEAMLPHDGTAVPFRDDPHTSTAGRVTACIAALKPYPNLYGAVSPLLDRVSNPPPG